MNTPPIYPEGYNPDLVVDCSFEDTFYFQCPGPRQSSWPTMLGLLAIIGDAVRGVPWGSPLVSPVLPEVGSVWIHTDGWIAEVIEIERDDEQGPVEYHIHLFEGEAWRLDRFLHCFRPATVIPTPTADGWRHLAYDLPDEGEVCWWWSPSHQPHTAPYMRLYHNSDWLWQPVPPGVIPPPPADRDGGQS